MAGWIGSYGGGDSPSDIQRGVFASEVGNIRLLNLFKKYKLKTTFFIPGHSIESFPDQVKRIADEGHEIGAHGYLHENPIAMTPTQEEDVLAYTVDLIQRVSGQKPRGYVAPRLQRIVLETSGLADPAPIVEAIRSDPILVHHILVSEVLVTVDALHALAQLRSEPLGRRQIEIADSFMVTKLDECPAEHVRKLLATLQAMNPGAAMFGSVRGSEVTLPDIGDAEPEILASIAEGEEQTPIFPTRIVIDDTIDWAAFSVWLSALLHARGDDVVRVKGVVRTPAGRLLVQTVRKIVQSPEMLPEQDNRPDREDDVIVVIGRGYEPEALVKSLRYFAARSPSST